MPVLFVKRLLNLSRFEHDDFVGTRKMDDADLITKKIDADFVHKKMRMLTLFVCMHIDIMLIHVC